MLGAFAGRTFGLLIGAPAIEVQLLLRVARVRTEMIVRIAESALAPGNRSNMRFGATKARSAAAGIRLRCFAL